MQFVLTICFHLIVSTISDDTREEGVPRIIGGFVCSEQDHRFVVSIRNQKLDHVCGGTLLNEFWVLTAAHCIRMNPTVHAGLNYLTGFKQYIAARVVDMYPHPQYNKKTMDNDIALFRLESPLAVDDYFIQYVKLPRKMNTESEDIYEQQQKCLVMGWGVTDIMIQEVSFTLQCLFLPLIKNDKCSQLYKNFTITKNMICTFSEDEEDACQGDSGGPLICEDKQIGIISWGVDCAGDYPGVYTKIDRYLDFIEKTMKHYQRAKSTAMTLSTSDSSFLFVSTLILSNI
ncbi:trypsin [Leptinotarsa decemlineata]|uniref:trypsin n=1 Tax=Leptinotarsa decemlineata TaxID=7539 RepID=UPI000C2543F3|nr:trypsin-like [Leptinotarsa decemlineata]